MIAPQFLAHSFVFFWKTIMIDLSASQPLGSDSVALVEGILAGEDGAVARLFASYRRGLTFYFGRQFGPQDAEDLVTEALTVVWEAIRSGSIREPERLAGFVMTIARRIGYRVIEERTHSRRAETSIDDEYVGLNGLQTAAESPEDSLFKTQQQTVMLRVLREMSERDRDVLRRFYLLEQAPEQIQLEMGMTETQFRLTKHRAKSRFGELGKKLLTPPVARRSARSQTVSIGRAACA
jgi:RNA polymerase sigma-70 factor (ECF subfamily)